MLHPSRVKSYSQARRWVLDLLVQRLLGQLPQPVYVLDQFRYAMFCLLVLMCFGDKLLEEKIKEIEIVRQKWLLSIGRLNLFMLWPKLGRILLAKRWKALIQARKDQEDIFIPLIRAGRKARKKSNSGNHQQEEEESVAYMDTLVDSQLP